MHKQALCSRALRCVTQSRLPPATTILGRSLHAKCATRCRTCLELSGQQVGLLLPVHKHGRPVQPIVVRAQVACNPGRTIQVWPCEGSGCCFLRLLSETCGHLRRCTHQELSGNHSAGRAVQGSSVVDDKVSLVTAGWLTLGLYLPPKAVMPCPNTRQCVWSSNVGRAVRRHIAWVDLAFTWCCCSEKVPQSCEGHLCRRYRA